LAFFGGVFGFFMLWQSGNPASNSQLEHLKERGVYKSQDDLRV